MCDCTFNVPYRMVDHVVYCSHTLYIQVNKRVLGKENVLPAKKRKTTTGTFTYVQYNIQVHIITRLCRHLTTAIYTYILFLLSDSDSRTTASKPPCYLFSGHCRCPHIQRRACPGQVYGSIKSACFKGHFRYLAFRHLTCSFSFIVCV